MSIENNMNEKVSAYNAEMKVCCETADSNARVRKYNNHDRKPAENNTKKQKPIKQKNFKYNDSTEMPQQKTIMDRKITQAAREDRQKPKLQKSKESFPQGKPRKSASKLKIIPLGGLEQIGMNITAFEYEDSIVVVDCGLAFPEDDMLGIDLVIPDVTYLKENISKVKGFVITHGHEDHIGALPYVLKEVNVPIYSTKLTFGLITNKLKEHNLVRSTKLKEVKHGQVINLGDFSH